MTTGTDFLGNPVSTRDTTILAGINDFVGGFITYESRAAGIVKTAAAAPDCALANAYAGALFMLLESPEGPVRARPFLDLALTATGANEREQAFIGFLAAWVEGDIALALSLSDAIVERWPRDLTAVKLHQYLTFSVGDAPAMLRIALKAAPACLEIPQVHGMMAFGYEQCHLLADAEAAATRALELTQREPWAQHALAHVMLTQGRIDEGERFMAAAAPDWSDLNSFMVTHNWWHLALFRISQGRPAAVLEIYDRHCWAHDRDYSQDQVGAVSLLARLELAGFDVGDRWHDVAGRIAARGPDVEQPFLALHYLYALARAARPEAEAQLEAFRRQARTASAFNRAAWANVALPAAEGIVAFLTGRPEDAIAKLNIATPELHLVGGSHAQRDLFDQVRLGAIIAAGRWSDAQQALELRRAREPDGVAVNLALAQAYRRLDLPTQSAEAERRARARQRREMAA